MAFTSWQKTIVDEAGDILPGATVEVRLESTGNLATIYSDDTGTAKANPFTADSEGFAIFYAAAGFYKITATSGAFSKIHRFVPIGSLQGFDAGTTDSTFQNNGQNRDEFLALSLDVNDVATTTYTLTATDNGTMIRTTSSSAVTITLPQDSTEALAAGFQCAVQKGGTGDITFVVEGSDTLESADSITTITTQYAAASIVKQASGDWWLAGGIEPILADGTTTGDVATWNGTSWEAGLGLADLGWLNVVDGTYTPGSPLSVTGGVRTQLDITYGGSSDATYMPRGETGTGTGGWWDDVESRFLPQNVGDSYDVRLSFKCDPTVNNDSILIEYSIDETSSPKNIIASNNVRLATSSTVEGNVSWTVGVFSLTTFVTNGLKIFVTPGAAMDFYDMSVLIKKTSDGRA